MLKQMTDIYHITYCTHAQEILLNITLNNVICIMMGFVSNPNRHWEGSFLTY